MSKVITEGALIFSFNDNWQTLKYDDPEGFHEKSMKPLNIDAHAVDIVAIYQEKELFLIEVKDYRQRKKPREPELSKKLQRKIVDTVAGLVGLSRQDTNPMCKSLRRLLITPNEERKHLKIILWMEDILPGRSLAQKSRAGILQKQLRSAFRWLNADVLVCSMASHQIKGLTVHS